MILEALNKNAPAFEHKKIARFEEDFDFWLVGYSFKLSNGEMHCYTQQISNTQIDLCRFDVLDELIRSISVEVTHARFELERELSQ